MADYIGRYFSERDRNFMYSVTKEYFENIYQVVVQLYKVCPNETKINMYGEVDQSTGKFYFTPITITTLIKKDDITTDNETFGPNRKQNKDFIFREVDLQALGFFPQSGDLISYNQRMYEVDNVTQENFLGQQPDKSWSIICASHYTTFSKLNIIPRNS